MLFELKILIICSVFLYLINYFQKKYNFCLDAPSSKESHKILLKLNKKVPLSGSFYFIPFIFFLTYQDNINLFITCLLFFCIGLLSDLKITNSPKKRLLIQFFLLVIFLFFNNDFRIDTRIEILNLLMSHEILRIIIISFFFLVLINGFNFIDGVNSLSSLNILIVLFFLYFLSKDIDATEIQNLVHILLISLSVFVIFNFFGKNFLGDGGVYSLSFFLGVIVIQLSILSEQISPYYIANLLWYPAFENLFSIVRRIISNKKNYLADNNHLHQLLFKFFHKKNIFKKKYLLSSFIGILINFYLFLFYLIGFEDYSDTKRQLFLILINTLIYLFIYYLLQKKIND